MSRRILKREAAKRDLDEQAAFLGDDSPQAAIRFLEAAEESFQLLAQMPQLGVRCHFHGPLARDLRRWPIRGFEKHLVFYRPIRSGIEVVRVIHAARDIERLFE